MAQCEDSLAASCKSTQRRFRKCRTLAVSTLWKESQQVLRINGWSNGKSSVFKILSLERADGFEIFEIGRTFLPAVSYAVISMRFPQVFYTLYVVFQGLHTAFRKDSAYVTFLNEYKINRG